MTKLLIFVLFYSQFSYANVAADSTAENAYLKLLCAATNTKCEPSKLPQALQLKIHACKSIVESNECKEFIKREPEYAFSLKRCEPSEFCRDHLMQEINSLAGCKDGFLYGTGENFVGIYDAVTNWWANLEKKAEQKLRFLKACDPDIQCRQELAAGIARFSKHTPEQLMKVPIVGLYQARIDHDRFGDIKIEGARTQLERIKREREAAKNNPKTKTEPQSSDKSMFEAAKNWLEQKAIRYQCVDKRTQAELTCWAAAYIIDPTIVAGAISKAPALSKGAQLFAKYAGIKATETTGAQKAAALARVERRTARPREVQAEALLGTRQKTLNIIPDLPDSIQIAEYKGADGTKKMVMERAIVDKDGKIVTVVREVKLDPLTGAIDASTPGGKYLFDSILRDKQGTATLAFIDVNNLGYVNKNFSGKHVAGDEYLKKTAEAISRATNGKATLGKLGGDEFGLIINETDPKKVQAIIDRAINEVYSADVHSTFKAEKVAKAADFKKQHDLASMSKEEKAAFAKQMRENPSSNTVRQFAPYSKEGISIGSTRVGKGEGLAEGLARAEQQATQSKIVAKEELNIDATKYGGKAASPDKKPNLKFVPEPLEPVPTRDLKTSATVPSLKQSKGLATEQRQGELYRIGDIAVVNYENAAGQTVTRYEKYSDGSGALPTKTEEINMNENTSLIDSTKGSGENVATLSLHAKGSDKAVIWVNAENLGKVNYFEKGTAAGDELLAATSDVIQREVGKAGIPFKGQGSEFAVTTSGLTDSQVRNLNERIADALHADPRIQKVYDDQEGALRVALQKARGNARETAVVLEKMRTLEKLRPTFTVRSTSTIPQNARMGEVVQKLKDGK